MPGATFVTGTPSGIPGPAGAAPAAGPARASANAPSTASFLLWLAIFGIAVPVVILGGLNAGRFRFVYVGR